MTTSAAPILELRFPFVSRTIPADHGYAVFSAICTLLPEVRIEANSIPYLAILPISGQLAGPRRILPDASSCMAFRLPQNCVQKLLPLAGKSLPLPGNSTIILGAPSISVLESSENLYSRVVTIKVRDLKESSPVYAERFLAAARRMAGELGIASESLSLVRRRMPASVEGKSGARDSEPWIRRTVSIRRKTIVGYALMARGLSPDASLALQSSGLGGRRHFGCGVFVNHDRYSTP